MWTIGYGHTQGVGPHSPRLTERQASELLERDLAHRYEPHVERLPIARSLNQHQFDALVSFVYNLGPGAIAADTGIGRALRARQWQRAADEMLRWDKAGGQVLAGLTRRRKAERALFLKPATARPVRAADPARAPLVPRVRRAASRPSGPERTRPRRASAEVSCAA